MEKREIIAELAELFASVPGNVLSREDRIKSRYIGTVMFDAPIVGFGAADDALFEKYKEHGVIGPWHMSPCEWLDGAETVISLFFPISEEIRRSNYAEKSVGSTLWAYARIEGQAYIIKYMLALKAWLEENGVRACVPAADGRFEAVRRGEGIRGYAEIDEHTYGSRWSERHAAYVCGLGTFGLSKGLITEKGMAGRFGSIIVDLSLAPDVRGYSGVYDHCISCGACVKRCPVNAIDPVSGKDHAKCHANVGKSGVIHFPRYGCGLCQTKVPCESSRPIKQI